MTFSLSSNPNPHFNSNALPRPTNPNLNPNCMTFSLSSNPYPNPHWLSPEADGNFCCRTYKGKDSQFPGAVPKDWMRSMYLYQNKSGGDTVEGFSGDYYTGATKYYYASGALSFWFMETDKGVPVEQGEGCYQPGVKPRQACGYTLPIMLYHDYDPASFKAHTSPGPHRTNPSREKKTLLLARVPPANLRTPCAGLVGGKPGTVTPTPNLRRRPTQRRTLKCLRCVKLQLWTAPHLEVIRGAALATTLCAACTPGWPAWARIKRA
jgi:hypothetical protein